MKNTISIIFLILITSTLSYSQLKPVGLIPLKYNGSFAGMTGEGRFTMNLNHGFSNSNSEKDGFYVSYDDFIERWSTGIALTTYHYKHEELFYYGRFIDSTSFNIDSIKSVDKVHKGNYVELAIAPKISIKGKYTISPSVKIKYGEGNDRYARNKVSEFDQDFNHLDITGGVTINTPKYYIGYAVRLYNKGGSNIIDSTFSFENPLSFYSVLEAGYSFDRKDESSIFSFTPQIAFHIASGRIIDLPSSNLDFNLRFQYGQLIYGHSYSSVFFSYSSPSPEVSTDISGGRLLSYLGWQKEYFRGLAMVSFDDVVEIHINLRYIIPHKDKKGATMFF